MFFQIHMLKNYPPTALNRDEAGAPKTCVFGGAVRARISSQCLKHSWRTSPLFQKAVGPSNLGIRTRTLPTLVKEKLIELGIETEIAEACLPVLSGFGTKEGKPTKNNDTAGLIFCSPADVDAIAEAVYDTVKDCSKPKDVAKKLKIADLRALLGNHRPVALDVALSGRMVTDETFHNVDAAMAVAHAFSANRESAESDFFVGLDDCLTGQGSAAMMGDRDFNSSCYYIYASIDADHLLSNLEGVENAPELVKKTILAMLRTMAFTNPSGSQNAFSGQVLPCTVMIECSEEKIPVSMANAYTEPVTRDLISESIKRLANEVDMLDRNYGLPVKERLWFCVDKYDIKPESATKVCASFQDLLDAVEAVM